MGPVDLRLNFYLHYVADGFAIEGAMFNTFQAILVQGPGFIRPYRLRDDPALEKIRNDKFISLKEFCYSVAYRSVPAFTIMAVDHGVLYRPMHFCRQLVFNEHISVNINNLC